MTLDDLIKRLKEIRDEHGGELPVWIGVRGDFERDITETKYKLPFPDADEHGHSEGVLIG